MPGYLKHFSLFLAVQALIEHKASNREKRATFSCWKLKFELLLLYFKVLPLLCKQCYGFGLLRGMRLHILA